METKAFADKLSEVPPDQRGAAVAQAVKQLSKEDQRVVAAGIDKGAWPQESMHRMITILGSVVAALGAAALAILANETGSKEIGTALIALATGIVGGIFGYAQASK